MLVIIMPKKDLLLILMLFSAVIGVLSLVMALNYLVLQWDLNNFLMTGVTALLFLAAAFGMFKWNSLGWYAFQGGMIWSIVINVNNVLNGGIESTLYNLAYILLYVFVMLWMMEPEVMNKYNVKRKR